VRRPEDEPEETLRHQTRHEALDLPPAPRHGSLVPRWLALVVLIALLAAAATGVWQLLTSPTREPGDALRRELEQSPAR
jgi:hypothetical protein